MYSSLVKWKNPRHHPTFKDIAKRMKDCNIDIDLHIKNNLKVYESTLDGISFIATEPENKLIPFDIKPALQQATKGRQKAFRQGVLEDARHWALDASMAATTGVGFREIWRPVLTNHGLRMDMATKGPGLNTPKLNNPFSDNFGSRMKSLDISSLHCAVHGNFCSIHIDETGFVMEGLPGLSNDVTVTPDFLQHLLVELFWKDKLKVPTWLDLVIPSSTQSRVGLKLNLVQSDKINLTVTGTCAVNGKFDCSGTVNAFGRFGLGGG